MGSFISKIMNPFGLPMDPLHKGISKAFGGDKKKATAPKTPAQKAQMAVYTPPSTPTVLNASSPDKKTLLGT